MLRRHAVAPVIVAGMLLQVPSARAEPATCCTGTDVIRSAVYGYLDPDTCGALEVKAFAVHSVPTGHGPVDRTNHFTASFKPLSDGVMAATFKGDRFSGRFTLRPLEGDCVTTPLTLFEGIWEGFPVPYPANTTERC